MMSCKCTLVKDSFTISSARSCDTLDSLWVGFHTGQEVVVFDGDLVEAVPVALIIVDQLAVLELAHLSNLMSIFNAPLRNIVHLNSVILDLTFHPNTSNLRSSVCFDNVFLKIC